MGDFFRGIGNGISSAAEWTGQTARSVGSAAWGGTVAAGTAVRDGAVVVWDTTAEAANTAANYGAAVGAGTNLIPGLSPDASMRPQIGRSEGYPGGWAENEAVDRQIKVKIPFQRGAQRAAAVANAQTGASTTIQAPAQSFLYMDVGRWGGTGADGRRDFGLVCGRTAALCAYTQGNGGRRFKDYGSVPLTDGPQDEINPINALLGKLVGEHLGAPKVRRYITSRAPLPHGVTTIAQRVYVVVGDMHLPVVTDKDPDGNVVPRGAQSFEQAELRGRRVGRARRVDMFKDLGVISDSDAALWHERYVAAEIFQEAGLDLTEFVGMMTRARGNIGAELWLMQLGDMFDLWLGFDCFLASDPLRSSRRSGNEGRVRLRDMVEAPPPDPTAMAVAAMGAGMVVPMVMPAPDGTRLQDVAARTVATAVEFVDTWINRTMNRTWQGRHVKTFLQFDPNASKFLYGNHDNYLGAHAPSQLMQLRGGQGMSKEHHDARGFFYACHGHQWDGYNRDGATSGAGATQAAFWGGQFVRSAEGLLDSRESTFLGAADLHRSGSKPFNVFAMGHTHIAILTEVIIEMEPEPPPVEYPPMPIM